MRTRKNRGAFLEEWLELTNQVYERKGQAIITKIPTPWKVQRKYQPFKNTYEIANAFPEKKSTVDFGGTAKNLSIWFDVKSTTQKQSFPLSNIHSHQIEYLKKVHAQGGKAFFLIYSEVMNKVWLIWISQLIKFMEEGTRKSLTFVWLHEHCAEIKSNNGIPLDYLPEVFRHQSEG